MFIIQACRGRDTNDWIDSQDVRRTSLQRYCRRDNDLEQDQDTQSAPLKSWFFIVNSTIKGYSGAWRHVTEGSFFIQYLCQELKTNGYRKSILEIVTDTVHRLQQEQPFMAPVLEYSFVKKTYLTDFS